MDRLDKLLQLISVIDDKSVANPTLDSGFPFRGINNGKVAIRTITHYYTGQVTYVADGFVYLNEAAWIPDTGRWSTFVEKGTPNEVEPADRIAVNIGSIVDVVSWNHELPTKVK